MENNQAEDRFQELFSKLTGSGSDFFIFPTQELNRRGLIGYTQEINMRLLYSAYLQGVFPWFNEYENEPVLWWSPDPRFVLIPEELHIPKSLAKFLKHSPFTYTMDKAFEQVITECSKAERPGQDGTWIGPKIIQAYCQLHKDGVAHSVEVWHDGNLAGGFYGVLIGRVFFGESMFSKESNTSKSAFIHFVRAFKNAGGKLIDSQVYTDNIARYGGKNISREAFLHYESEFLFEPLQEELSLSFYKTVEKNAECK